MSRYDLIVAGAGLGGLSFLWHLMEADLQGRRVLVIDRSFKATSDRTWCFWGPPDSPFAEVAVVAWDHAEVCFEDQIVSQGLGEERYFCARSEDFRSLVTGRLIEHPNIDLLKSSIESIGEDDRGPYVMTGEGRHDASWVLQSVQFGPEDSARRLHTPVRQHFGGLEVRTAKPVFTPDRFTMMDFRVPQRDGLSFVYVLPFAPDRALVEHTVFSASPMSPEAHFEATEDYIWRHLETDFRIERREAGDLPMDDRMPAQQSSPHVFNVGIVGGQIKPSTGYTFARVQRYTQALASGFAETGALSPVTPAPTRFQLYDLLLLRILFCFPQRGLEVFRALLTTSPIRRVLAFLDERTGLSQEFSMFRRLPIFLFAGGLPSVLWRAFTRWVGGIPAAGLGIAAAIFAGWVGAISAGLAGAHPGAGEPLADMMWIALSTFLSTGVFITAHEAMHGLVAPGHPRINRWVGWCATWAYAGLDYGKLERAHHRHHAAPASEEDPDFHTGNSNILFWYKDFMVQYLSWRQFAWLNALVMFMVVGLSLPFEQVLLFWAAPLILSTAQLFVVGTWLPHRPGVYQGEGPLRARSLDLPPVLSFLACFHFGYHFEHHARPDLPWWRLWQVRGAVSPQTIADARLQVAHNRYVRRALAGRFTAVRS